MSELGKCSTDKNATVREILTDVIEKFRKSPRDEKCGNWDFSQCRRRWEFAKFSMNEISEFGKL